MLLTFKVNYLGKGLKIKMLVYFFITDFNFININILRFSEISTLFNFL